MPRFLRVLFLVPFLFLPTIARADSVPALTIIGGTITGGRIFSGGGITFSLIGIDPATGTIYNISSGSEGGFFTDPFAAAPGQMVTFSAGIQGNVDLGFALVQANISGISPPIPNVMQLSLDLQGAATATIQGTFYASFNDLINQNPLFTIPSQSFGGPAVYHFITIAPGDPRYELKSVTLSVPEPVPEPASVILLVTALSGLGLFSKRRKRT